MKNRFEHRNGQSLNTFMRTNRENGEFGRNKNFGSRPSTNDSGFPKDKSSSPESKESQFSNNQHSPVELNGQRNHLEEPIMSPHKNSQLHQLSYDHNMSNSVLSTTDSNEILRKMMHELRFLIQHIDVAELTLRDKCLKYVKGEEAHVKAIEEDLIKQRQSFEEEKVRHASETARSRVLEQEKLKKSTEDSKKIAAIEKENEDLKEKQARIQAELSTLRVKNSELKRENNALEKSSTENHKQMLQSKSDLSKSEREKADLRVQLSIFKSNCAQLEEQLNKVKKTASRKFEPLRKTVVRDQALQQHSSKKEDIDKVANFSLNASAIQPNTFSTFAPDQMKFQLANLDATGSYPGFMPPQPSSAPPRVQWAEPLFNYKPSPNSSVDSLQAYMNNQMSNYAPSLDFVQRTFPSELDNRWPLKPDMKYVESKRSDDGLTHVYFNGEKKFSHTKLKCHCTVYCYDDIDYIWHYRKPEKLKVFYSGNGKVFQLDTPDDWNIRIFSNGHFEIHRPSQEDVSTIQANNKRSEMISHALEAPTFEIFEPNGEAYKLDVNGYKTFIDANQSKSVRRDGSQILILPNAVEYQSKDKDFAIHRVTNGIVRVIFKLCKLELNFCPGDLFFLARHMEEKDGEMTRRKCFQHGLCPHLLKP